MVIRCLLNREEQINKQLARRANYHTVRSPKYFFLLKKTKWYRMVNLLILISMVFFQFRRRGCWMGDHPAYTLAQGRHPFAVDWKCSPGWKQCQAGTVLEPSRIRDQAKDWWTGHCVYEEKYIQPTIQWGFENMNCLIFKWGKAIIKIVQFRNGIWLPDKKSGFRMSFLVLQSKSRAIQKPNRKVLFFNVSWYMLTLQSF